MKLIAWLSFEYVEVPQMDKPSSEFDILSSDDIRSGVEEKWVTFQPYLLSKGYRLRPRYHPDWVPSWKKDTSLHPSDCEDSFDCMVCVLGFIDIPIVN